MVVGNDGKRMIRGKKHTNNITITSAVLLLIYVCAYVVFGASNCINLVALLASSSKVGEERTVFTMVLRSIISKTNTVIPDGSNFFGQNSKKTSLGAIILYCSVKSF